jgi:hypothetical protein
MVVIHSNIMPPKGGKGGRGKRIANKQVAAKSKTRKAPPAQPKHGSQHDDDEDETNSDPEEKKEATRSSSSSDSSSSSRAKKRHKDEITAVSQVNPTNLRSLLAR